MVAGPGPSVWDWFAGGAAGGSHVEIVLCTRNVGSGVYDTNVPKDAFQEALKRAVLSGYRPAFTQQHSAEAASQARHSDLKVYRARDMIMEAQVDAQQPQPHEGGGAPLPARHRVLCRRLLQAYDLPGGAPVLACLYAQDRMPFHAFSCGAHLHDVRRVRRLVLRMHGRANLVFEVSQKDQPGAAVVRTIRIEVALPAATGPQRVADGDGSAVRAARSDSALKRCVEQVVQTVMMPAAAPGASSGRVDARRRSAQNSTRHH